MMEKIYIICDSASNLKISDFGDKSLKIIPYIINFKDKSIRDGEISNDEFLNLLNSEIPKTSIPSISDVREAYMNAIKKGYKKILAISVSSKISGMYNVFNLAREGISAEIEVIDSIRAGYGTGLLVRRAFDLIEKKYNFKDIAKKLRQEISENHLIFTIENLRHMKKGGRSAMIRGRIAEILNIKPIIKSDKSGGFSLYKSVRSRKKALRVMADALIMEIKDKKNFYIAISHASCEDDARTLEGHLAHLIERSKYYKLDELSQTLYTHSGPLGISLHAHCFND